MGVVLLDILLPICSIRGVGEAGPGLFGHGVGDRVGDGDHQDVYKESYIFP